MIYVGRWQTISVILILLLGALFAAPNFIPEAARNAMPGWLPKSTVRSLGQPRN